MKKLLCIALTLMLVLACVSTAVADNLLQIVPEIEQGSSDSGSSNSGSTNSGNNNSGGGASFEINIPGIGGSPNSGTQTTPPEDKPETPQLPEKDEPQTPEVPGLNITLDGELPLNAGVQNSGNSNQKPENNNPVVDPSVMVGPLEGGIEEEEIGELELVGDAMHSLRIRSSIKAGSRVKIGERVELTAIPMGFAGVNYKIQWQTAVVDENGNMSPYRNIPNAYGTKLVIVFDKDNINDHWRAAIKIVD